MHKLVPFFISSAERIPLSIYKFHKQTLHAANSSSFTVLWRREQTHFAMTRPRIYCSERRSAHIFCRCVHWPTIKTLARVINSQWGCKAASDQSLFFCRFCCSVFPRGRCDMTWWRRSHSERNRIKLYEREWKLFSRLLFGSLIVSIAFHRVSSAWLKNVSESSSPFIILIHLPCEKKFPRHCLTFNLCTDNGRCGPMITPEIKSTAAEIWKVDEAFLGGQWMRCVMMSVATIAAMSLIRQAYRTAHRLIHQS